MGPSIANAVLVLEVEIDEFLSTAARKQIEKGPKKDILIDVVDCFIKVNLKINIFSL